MATQRASGQLTLTDLNDAIISGTAPSNPSVGTLWVDESTNPNTLKKYNGTGWDIIGEIMDSGTGTTITTITTTLGNMTDDGKIDFTERQYVKDKLTGIIGYVMADTTTTLPTTSTLDSSAKGSFYTSRKSALNAGLTTSDTNYTNLATQYNNLKTYLEGLTPVDAWDTGVTHKDSVIVVTASTWRDKWLQYYLAEQALDTATALKLKQNVDNVSVGGRNLMDTGFTPIVQNDTTTGNNLTVTPYTYNGINGYRLTKTTNGGWGSYLQWDLVDGAINDLTSLYSFSVFAVNLDTTKACSVTDFLSNGQSLNIAIDSESKSITGTLQRFKFEGKSIKSGYDNTKNDTHWHFNLGICDIFIAQPKFEKGNKSTDYTPAPEEMPSTIYDTVFNVNKQNIISTVTSSTEFNTALTQPLGDFVFNNGASNWVNSQGGTTPPTATIVKDSGAKYGANAIQISNQLWAFYGTPIPVNIDHVYRVKFRVKQTVNPTTAGTSKVYAGVASFDQNKNPLTTSTYGTHRYCAVQGTTITTTDGWKEFEGTISGEGDEGYDQFITGTKYAVPMFIVNYSAGDGTALVDVCSIEDITDTNNLGTQLADVQQSMSADGITTLIQKSTFYSNDFKNVQDKPDFDDLSKYALGDDLDKTNQSVADLSDKVDGIDLTSYATKTYVDTTATGITDKFSATGGMNLLKNSIGFSDFTFWTRSSTATGAMSTISNNELQTLGFGSGFQFNSYTATRNIYQDVPVIPNKPYTISWYAKKTNSATGTGNDNSFVVQILNPSDGSGLSGASHWYYNTDTTNGYEESHFTFTPTIPVIRVRIYAYQYAVASITGLMLTIGDMPLMWSLATGETYNTNVRLDINGIRVSQLDANSKEIGYTSITPSEFAGWYDTNGDGVFEKVFYLNGDETVTKKLTATDEITMGTIKVLKIDSGGYSGWAFVPLD